MTWQPIETAPRDGTDVLLYVPRPSRYPELIYPPIQCVGHWRDDLADGWWRLSYVEGYEYDTELNNYHPTHWQPLPTAPE
jgi:hypothetical protein